MDYRLRVYTQGGVICHESFHPTRLQAINIGKVIVSDNPEIKDYFVETDVKRPWNAKLSVA